MIPLAAPATVAELVEVVRSCPRLLAIGGQTKPRLSAVQATKVSTSRLHGIVEYEPSEFTFTAMAGTPVRELAEALAHKGQYLPFDPLLLAAGTTLGGTVASAMSGPGRLRFGGVRDFILGAKFIDGLGRQLRVGGKVVKNAAGFDLPKFFVGSLGRFGVLTELTFKVFPAPASTLTLKLASGDIETATKILLETTRGRWETQAVDILPGECQVCLRLAGPAQALAEMAREIFKRWPGQQMADAESQKVWQELREFNWAHPGGPLVKIALTPSTIPTLAHGLESIEDARMHVSSGGNLAFVSLAEKVQAGQLDQLLRNSSLAGVTLRGEAPLWCGVQSRFKIAEGVKRAVDPENRFPALDE